MRIIPLRTAFAILQSAPAVLVDDGAAIPALNDLTGQGEHCFMEVAFAGGVACFREGDNVQVEVDGSWLRFIGADEDEYRVRVLVALDVEVALDAPVAPPPE